MKRIEKRIPMARIDLARRAQIGRDRRTADAARALYALNPIEAVTVDDLIGEAVAKKTFYVHFDGLAELQAAVADQLAHEFDELLQPRRLATEDPVERIAAGCGAFVGEALSNPAWGALVARAGSYPCRTSRLARRGA
jgi:AcrR family transcriptional regulator